MNPSYAVILVYSTSYALRVEKILQGAGINTKLIPVPRHLSSDCGVCVRILQTDQDQAVQQLEKDRCEYASIHPLADWKDQSKP